MNCKPEEKGNIAIKWVVENPQPNIYVALPWNADKYKLALLIAI